MAEQQQEQVKLVFIPFPGVGHLVSMVELAKLLILRYSTLSVSLLVITSPSNAATVTTYTDSLSSSDYSPRINLLHLPHDKDLDQPGAKPDPVTMMESRKSRVREAVSADHSPSFRLAGFVLDMFCTSMLDVADEFGVPSYIFFTSAAASLAFIFHIQHLHDDEGYDFVAESKEDDAVNFPGLANPVPRSVFPPNLVKKGGGAMFYRIARDFRKTRGILVNTVNEVESHAIHSLSRGFNPKVYPVGPILNLNSDTSASNDVVQWLDQQPDRSVVFLCFGSMGAFRGEQVREIAVALERSGQRFLWSLRRPAGEGQSAAAWASPTDYEDVREVLPEGFVDRTAEVGRVIGWAPQTAVLAHKATGGFVSHCGWNSTLESLWFGVPMATWPMYAEQQLNAFLLVKELGIGTEIKMDYRVESGEVVMAEEIERGIRSLMDKEEDCLWKKKLKEFSGMTTKALANNGGSSSASIAEFLANL